MLTPNFSTKELGDWNGTLIRVMSDNHLLSCTSSRFKESGRPVPIERRRLTIGWRSEVRILVWTDPSLLGMSIRSGFSDWMTHLQVPNFGDSKPYQRIYRNNTVIYRLCCRDYISNSLVCKRLIGPSFLTT